MGPRIYPGLLLTSLNTLLSRFTLSVLLACSRHTRKRRQAASGVQLAASRRTRQSSISPVPPPTLPIRTTAHHIMKGSTFLYPAIFKTALLPPLLIYLFNRLITSHHIPHPLRLPFWVLSVLYLLSWPTLFIIRSQISLSRAQIRARSLGASPIPRVHGRWPLNLDVLVDWSRSGSEEEVGRMMILLSRKYGGTYNTRVLGEDQVCRFLPMTFSCRLRGVGCSEAENGFSRSSPLILES